MVRIPITSFFFGSVRIPTFMSLSESPPLFYFNVSINILTDVLLEISMSECVIISYIVSLIIIRIPQVVPLPQIHHDWCIYKAEQNRYSSGPYDSCILHYHWMYITSAFYYAKPFLLLSTALYIIKYHHPVWWLAHYPCVTIWQS